MSYQTEEKTVTEGLWGRVVLSERSMNQCSDRLKIKQGCVKGSLNIRSALRSGPRDPCEKFCPEILYGQLCTSERYTLLLSVKVTDSPGKSEVVS